MNKIKEKPITIFSDSPHIEKILTSYKDVFKNDYDAYRGHVYRVLTYAMHFLNLSYPKTDESYRTLVETAIAYHDIGLWTHQALEYLTPSESLALKDNEEKQWGLNPDVLVAAIHWHHKITPYQNLLFDHQSVDIVNAIRKADWIDASQGIVHHNLPGETIQTVQQSIPDYGFFNVLQRLAKDLSGNVVKGNLIVLSSIIKF